MPSNFVNLVVTSEVGDFAQRVYNIIRTRWPDWEPADTNLETFLIDGFAAIAEELADLITTVGAEVFRKFGEEVINIPPQAATSASITSTWTLNDDLGHTIPIGTIVALRNADNELSAFRVVNEVTVAPGQTTTGVGAVTLRAVEVGDEYNELTGPAELIDALAYVDPGGVAVIGQTSGGADAEDPIEYLNRLAQRLRLMSETLVIPRDYEIVARDFNTVERAKAVDGYDAVAETYDNDRTLTVYVHDVDGNALSAPDKAEILAELEERSITNMLIYVSDPEYSDVDVTATLIAYEGFDLATVEAAAVEALNTYTDPRNWGAPPFAVEAGGWINEEMVYRRELESLLDRVPGVRRVEDLEFGLNGGAQSDVDKALAGAAPLTNPGVMDITVTF